MNKKISTKETMENLVEAYINDTEFASRDLAGWDYRTRNSAEMAKNQARDRLPQIFNNYSQVLSQTTTCFLVYGNDQEYMAFEKQLDSILKETMFFTDSTMSLYEFLSPRVEANMTADREFNVHSLMMLVAEMAILGKELNKISILEPKLDVVKITPDHEAVLDAIREAIMVNSQYSFMLEFVQYSFTKKALEVGHAANSTIFVLRCRDASEANDLSSTKSVPVDLSSTEDYSKLIKDTLKNTKEPK